MEQEQVDAVPAVSEQLCGGGGGGGGALVRVAVSQLQLREHGVRPVNSVHLGTGQQGSH